MGEEQIQFRFETVQIMHKSVYKLDESKPIPTVFAYEVKVEVRVQAERHLVIMNVLIRIIDTVLDTVYADYSVWCIFQVLEFEKHVILNDDGQYNIPVSLDNIIRPASISTSRGILYADLRNTYLSESIMPIVYMNDFKIPDQKPEEI